MQRYDIVVGIPSYNNGKTIGYVVKAVAQGLKQYFPDKQSLIINSDGGSRDETVDQFFKTKIPAGIRRESLRYAVVAGKGAALLHVFEQAKLYRTKACLMVDADLRSITPTWVESLAKPILTKDFDFVAPMYIRHKFDGTITRNLTYPMTMALYGVNVRQPIGGDFGLSGKLVARVLEKNVWETDVIRYGIDIFLSTTAIAEGFKVCQVHLGAKVHDPKDPRGLGPMFQQVCGTLFDVTGRYHGVWQKSFRHTGVPTFGRRHKKRLAGFVADIPGLISEFRRGLKRFRSLGQLVFNDEWAQLVDLSKSNPEKFVLDADLWARIIYRSVIFYCKRLVDRRDLLDLLVHLYFGRVATYIKEVQKVSHDDAEKMTEAITKAFINRRQYLLDLWKKPPKIIQPPPLLPGELPYHLIGSPVQQA